MMRRAISGVWLLAILAAAGLGVANLWLGELNQDEGWYLYAARLVSEGQRPYRDFAFTQAPVLPFVYALAQPAMAHGGVAGGRAVTMLLGLAAAFGAASLAGRITRDASSRGAAAALTFILTAVNVYQSYFTTVVKTYALCAFFLVGALWFVVQAERKLSSLAALVGGLLAMLAAGTRISAGAAVPLMALWLWLQPGGRCRRAAWSFALGASLTFVMVFLPCWLAAPECFQFCLFEYHAGRVAGSLAAALVYKAGFLSRVIQAYLVALSLGVALVVVRAVCRPAQGGPTPAGRGPRVLLWAVAAAISLVHLAAPFPYDDYQALVYPVFCAALAAAWLEFLAREPRAEPRARWALGLVVCALLLSGAAAISSPVNQSWMIRGRDRIWWRMKDQPDLAKLRQAAAWVREQSAPDDVLLTQDTYLAVEAGRHVPRGLEMGPFSYYPRMDRHRARGLHVLNDILLYRLLGDRRYPLAALSGYSFSIESPGVLEIPAAEQARTMTLVDKVFALDHEVPYFGQGATTLRLYRRREGPPAP